MLGRRGHMRRDSAYGASCVEPVTGVRCRPFTSCMARPRIVDDDLWGLVEPLLPPRPERSPGPRPVPARKGLQSILYVLVNDIARTPVVGVAVRLRADLLTAAGSLAAGQSL
ncbi:hypothetical protein GCM10010448_69680 [Streptomyces glomeratus]|uniref:Transposase n=1 Tax=Streptomyces glomeratus TaxID=284452 RepID=A0ABP6M861_9ACTN